MKTVLKNTDHQISEKMEMSSFILRDVFMLQIRTDPITDVLSQVPVKDRIVVHVIDTFREGGTGRR